jgi:dTMP kinase
MKMEPHRGMLIVFEGIDGTGKTTVARRVASYFSSLGREVVVSHEPTNGPWGRKLRESAAKGRMSAEEELDCLLQDRRSHVDELIRPALQEGKVVILDRYYFSTMAYQGTRGIDPGTIRQMNEEFAPIPDHLMILDLDVDEALLRIGGRGDTANHFERRDSLQLCREFFLSLANEPFARLVSAADDVDTVATNIIKHLDSPKECNT